MASKRQELATMRAQMYNKLESVKENYASLPFLEKVKFVQDAFNDINSYCCKKWNMNEKDTAFGFCIGRNSFAHAGNPKNMGPSVAYSLRSVEHFKNPYEIYGVLFHEMKHIHQSVSLTPGNFLQRLYPNSFYEKQTNAKWNASPKEIESDDFSLRELAKITKTGMLKSDTRVEACKQTQFFKNARVNSFVKHLKGVGQAVVETIKDKFGSIFKHREPEEHVYIGQEMHGGTRYFNFGTICQIVKGLPYELKDTSQLQGTPFRDFVNSRGDKAFDNVHYFGIHREHNKEANRIAVENYEKGDPLKIDDSQKARLSAARRQDIEKDRFLQQQHQAKQAANKEFAALKNSADKILINKDISRELSANLQKAQQTLSKNEDIQNLSNAINNLQQDVAGQPVNTLEQSSQNNEDILVEQLEQKIEDKNTQQEAVGNPELKNEILQHISSQKEGLVQQETSPTEQSTQTPVEATVAAEPAAMEITQ